MLSDTHCHIFSNYYYNVDDLINSFELNNIKRVIVNGYNKVSNEEVLNLIKYDSVYGALGIHPDNISDYNEFNFKFIEENLMNEKVVAIGEIGLDYYHNSSNKDEQISMFEKFLELAEAYNKPVIIHCRNASDDLLRILKRHNCYGVIHCFSGSYELACEYIKLGFKLGIGGVVTFKNSKLKDVLKRISVSDILIETDSPYLTPEPIRGNFNEPLNVNFIAKYLSDIYDISIDDLSDIMELNYNNVFNK